MALPDSVLSEEPGLREKTAKAGVIGRACAIFQVSRIYVYRDLGVDCRDDGRLLTLILRYLETPQYLRKSLYGKMRELLFAGTLPPLRTPHHKLAVRLTEIRAGEFREGCAFRRDGQQYVDVGLDSPIPLDGQAQVNERVTVCFTGSYPSLRCRVAAKSEAKEYWGYEVRQAPPLGRLVKSLGSVFIVFTSRLGTRIADVWAELVNDFSQAGRALVVFGSPRRGIYDILRDEREEPTALAKYILNLFPAQGTETIRTEEALLGSLAILNLASSLQRQSKSGGS